MSSRTYWLHVDTALQIAHLVALQLPLSEPVEADRATGFAYRNIDNLIEFTSHALDATYGDADSILMAAEMKGDLDLWLDLNQADFDKIAAAGLIIGCKRIPISGYVVQDGMSILLTPDKCAPAVPATLGQED